MAVATLAMGEAFVLRDRFACRVLFALVRPVLIVVRSLWELGRVGDLVSIRDNSS
jgi:hypothetical protein